MNLSTTTLLYGEHFDMDVHLCLQSSYRAAFSDSFIWTSTFGASACSAGDRNSGRNSSGSSRMLLESCASIKTHNKRSKCVDKGDGKSAVKCSHCLLLFLRGKFSSPTPPRDDGWLLLPEMCVACFFWSFFQIFNLGLACKKLFHEVC